MTLHETLDRPNAPRPVSTTGSVVIPGDVPANIVSLIPQALQLIERSFNHIRQIRACMASDPETDERWLGLQLTIDGDASVVADAYDHFVRDWVATIPWPDHHLVHVSFVLA